MKEFLIRLSKLMEEYDIVFNVANGLDIEALFEEDVYIPKDSIDYFTIKKAYESMNNEED